MAIIKSNTVGIAKGSLGNITYRTVNGRTIASQRVTKNKSNTPKQVARRNGFGETVRLASNLKNVIEIGFDKVKNGTKRNNFVSSNMDLRNYLSDPEVEINPKEPIVNLFNALNDERFFGQVLAAKGIINTQSKFWETEEGELQGDISLSRELRAGDTISIVVCFVYFSGKQEQAHSDIYSVTVGSSLIESLENNNHFPVNKETIPELENFKNLPKKEQYIGAVVAGIVSNNTERSTSYFSTIRGNTAR